MPDITVPLVSMFASGLALGGSLYSLARGAQSISGRVFAHDVWLHMLLTITLWAIAMVALSALLIWLVDLAAGPYARRGNWPWWGVGFFVGVPIGNILSQKRPTETDQ